MTLKQFYEASTKPEEKPAEASPPASQTESTTAPEQTPAVEPVAEDQQEEGTPAVADEAPVQTALSEQNRSETELNGQVAQEIGEHHDTVEQVADTLDNTLEEKGDVSVESLLIASVVIDHASRRLGLSDSLLEIPALESATLDDRIALDTSELHASLEGLGSGLKSILKNQISTFIRAWSFTATRATVVRKRMEGVLDAAKNTVGTQEKGTIEIDATCFHERGKFPVNFNAFVGSYIKDLRFLVGDFEMDAANAYIDWLKLANSTEVTTADKFPDVLNKLQSAMVDVRRKIKPATINGPLPGGVVLFEDQKLRYKGSNAAAKKLDAFAHKNFPTRSGFQGQPLYRKTLARPLTKEEVKSLATEMMETLRAIPRTQVAVRNFYDGLTTVTVTPANVFYLLTFGPLAALPMGVAATGKAAMAASGHQTGLRGVNKHIKRQYAGELRALKDAHLTLQRLSFYTGTDAAEQAVQLAEGLVRYMKKSLRTYR